MLSRPLLLRLKVAGGRLPTCISSGAGRACRASAIRTGAASRSHRPQRPYSTSTSATPATNNRRPSKDSRAPVGARAPQKDESIQIESLVDSQKVLPVRPNLWLRDVCPCPKCVDPHSGQKSFATTELDFLPAVRRSERHDDGSLTVVWANDPVSGGEDHTSIYPPSVADGFSKILRRDLWNRDIYENERQRCRVSYSDWMAGGSEFWHAMAALSSKGLIFVYDVPQGDEQAVERLGERIGALQETFYGRTWDVVSKPQAENVAYTNHFLGLHQDLLYYPDPPRIQLLHCLANECEGGESLFSDGVYAAMLIAARRKATFEALVQHPTAYHYNKNGNVYYAERPVVRARPGTKTSMVDNVWWSPPFQAPFPIDTSHMGAWYLAAKQFQEEIERPEHMVEYRLQPGECVVFDNWRVLHGRQQFNSSSGRRHLKGTYIDDKTYRARYDDMPAALTRQHRLWTDRHSELKQNQYAVQNPLHVQQVTEYLKDPKTRAADTLLLKERQGTLLRRRNAPGLMNDLTGKGKRDSFRQIEVRPEEQSERPPQA